MDDLRTQAILSAGAKRGGRESTKRSKKQMAPERREKSIGSDA